MANKYYKELECPTCKGYLHKYFFNSRCIRCGREFTQTEVERLWKEEFDKNKRIIKYEVTNKGSEENEEM